MLNTLQITNRLHSDLSLARAKVEIDYCRTALNELEANWSTYGVDMDPDHPAYQRFCNAAYGVCEIDELYREPDEDTYYGRVLDREADAKKVRIKAAEDAVIAAYTEKYGVTFVEQAMPRRFTRDDAEAA